VATNNLQLFLRHDGTDQPLDPTRGVKWRIAVRNDPGWADSLNSWTDMQLDLTTHFPLGENSWSRQQVLALNVWSTYSPTYEYKVSAGQVTASHAPPFISGTSLGGFFRMRAYPSNRFHDKAGVYYSGEYRSTLRWNPFTDVNMLKPLQIRWVQLVGFAELGNVAPDMSISKLHSDMIYDVGVGLRMSIKGIIARIDYAVAPNNSGAWFMLGHAF
jgi:outer membrane protein assembly factor BamA